MLTDDEESNSDEESNNITCLSCFENCRISSQSILIDISNSDQDSEHLLLLSQEEIKIKIIKRKAISCSSVQV